MASVNSLYARAFADVVIAHKLNAAQSIAQLEEISDLIKTSHELRVVWENPTVPMSQKLKLLDAIAGEGGLPKQARNFIGVLIEKHRLKVLPEITAQIKVELNERLGIAEAEISSARDLAPDERTALESQLAKTTGKKVQAHYARNPSLLGGALVRIGSTIYDGSVRGQLQAIKQQIAELERVVRDRLLRHDHAVWRRAKTRDGLRGTTADEVRVSQRRRSCDRFCVDAEDVLQVGTDIRIAVVDRCRGCYTRHRSDPPLE